MTKAVLSRLDIPYTTVRDVIMSPCPRKLSRLQWRARNHRTLAPRLQLPVRDKALDTAARALAEKTLYTGHGPRKTSWDHHKRMAFRTKLLTGTLPTMVHKNRCWLVRYPNITCPFDGCEVADAIDHALVCQAMPGIEAITPEEIVAAHKKIRAPGRQSNHLQDLARADAANQAIRNHRERRMIKCGLIDEEVFEQARRIANPPAFFRHDRDLFADPPGADESPHPVAKTSHVLDHCRGQPVRGPSARGDMAAAVQANGSGRTLRDRLWTIAKTYPSSATSSCT